MSLVENVRSSVLRALGSAAEAGKLGDRGVDAVRSASAFVVERPKRPEHGDFATNAAMVLTKKAGVPPREVLVQALAGDSIVKSAEIAGPGFVNLRLHPAAFHVEVAEILRAGVAYGRGPSATGERIDLEFVSSNPTGPLTVGSARNAILGDSVARLLEATGNRVTREYYVNDFGNQIRTFARSVLAVARGQEVAEDGYKGAYIKEIASYVKQTRATLFDASEDELARACVTLMLAGIPGSRTLPGLRRTLADLGVTFDVWFSEESLHRWGRVELALAALDRDGFLQKKDGATFFVAKNEGALEDKDRVVRKSNGELTYFSSDIAYFADKVSRGYDRLMIVLGADHHGYVARVQNALGALGLASEKFEAILYQLVFILRGGEIVKSSKRAGNVITADEVMDEIDDAAARKGAGRDALRFFFLSRSANSQVDFDLDLAKKNSLDNPVFYVQYGHARLSSILRKAKEIDHDGALGYETARVDVSSLAKLDHPDELALAARAAEFPDAILEAAKLREPHRIVFYAQELAREFQSYFTQHKTDPILPPDSVRREADWSASWDHQKTRARLAWVRAIRIAYAAALDVIGVSAPERMDKPKGEGDDEA